MSTFQTEFRFRLPKGYMDPETNRLQKEGIMRLATARDEIVPLQDYRVQANRAYLVILLLSRVIKNIGETTEISVDVIENLFSTDLAYLQEFYRKINEQNQPAHHVACPGCQKEFDVDMATGAIVTEEGSAGRQGQG